MNYRPQAELYFSLVVQGVYRVFVVSKSLHTKELSFGRNRTRPGPLTADERKQIAHVILSREFGTATATEMAAEFAEHVLEALPQTWTLHAEHVREWLMSQTVSLVEGGVV